VLQIAPVTVELLADLSEEVIVSENGGNDMNVETRYAMLDRDAIERAGPPGNTSDFSCPECGGVLWETGEGNLLRCRCRCRCRVGYAYTAEDAVAASSESLDTAIWMGLRALLERADMCGRIAERARNGGSDATARPFVRLAKEAREQAGTIRSVFLERDGPVG
jgi:two-component system chemotaxis response regulator CheB